MVRGPVRVAARVVPARVAVVAVPVVEAAVSAVLAPAVAAVAVDTRPAVVRAADLVARARVVPARPAAAAAVPVVVPVDSEEDPVVVPAVGDDRVDRRNGVARSAVAIAPSSNRRHSGSRPPTHRFPRARSSSRAEAQFRSTRRS